VDLYTSGIAGITDYTVGLEVKNGLRGTFLIEEARVDTDRADFVFAGNASAQTRVDQARLIFEGSASDAHVDPLRSKYLGTVVFRATGWAEGTFTVRIHEGHTELRDVDGALIPYRAGAATILVGENLVPRWQK